MAKKAMDPSDFERLVSKIRQETDSHEKKINILSRSVGCFDAEQAGRILYELPRPSDKVAALRILEARLCLMTSREARTIVEAISIHNDRLIALDCVKRVLVDSQTPLGQEYSLSSLVFENDKHRARTILNTVSSTVGDLVAAGGHQGYTALGGLHTQARPLLTNLYGSISAQREAAAGFGKIQVIPSAKPGIIPSIYTGHPSYAYPPDIHYSEIRKYPGTAGYPAGVSATTDYPGGAPPLGFHSGAPTSTGFYNLDQSRIAY